MSGWSYWAERFKVNGRVCSRTWPSDVPNGAPRICRDEPCTEIDGKLVCSTHLTRAERGLPPEHMGSDEP